MIEQYRYSVEFAGEEVDFSQAKHWCHKEFGDEGTLEKVKNWKIKRGWDNYNSMFYFHDESDATMFKLMWG